MFNYFFTPNDLVKIHRTLTLNAKNKTSFVLEIIGVVKLIRLVSFNILLIL